MEKKQIIVIGSGFGGLAAAIRMQARGHQVTLFEKGPRLGGHASQFVKNGYTFDMGPSLITAPNIIRSVLEAAGVRMEDRLQLIPVDPFYRIYFHVGSYLDYSGDEQEMRDQLAAFHPDDAAGYDRFMEVSRAIHQAVIEEGLGSTPFIGTGVLLKFLPKAMKLNALLPAYSHVKRFFKDERSRFAFSFHPLFIGGNPFRAPSVYLMIPYLERAEGVWFTPGGMYRVVEEFERLFRELGGEVRTNTEVGEIVIVNGEARGVEANGGYYAADAVISNADWYHTNQTLLPFWQRRKWTDNRINRVAYSMGAFLLYLGVKKQYPQLKHHTLILSPRYRELVRDIFDRKVLPDDFSMYLHVPSRTDPGMAPEGCESMYVLIPVANLASGIDWSKTAEPFTEKVLAYLEEDFGLEGLRENIEVREVFTPADFQEVRNSHLGSAWGVEPKLTQTANFRPHNRHEDVDRLYLVGASTHPGAGLPGVLLTAETTEKLIVEDLNGEPEPRKL